MSFTDWPGVGDVPDEEPEGFRQEQIDAEAERRERVREEQEQRNQERADFYAGRSDQSDDEGPEAVAVS